MMDYNTIAAYESNIAVVVNLFTLAVLKGIVYIHREASSEGIDRLYRYIDFSVIGTFNIANSLLFISAIDSSFSAYTLYILALFIPVEVNKTLKKVALKHKYTLKPTHPEKVLSSIIPVFPLAILLLSFLFSTGIQSLEVCDNIRKLLTETTSPSVQFSYINVLSWLFYIPLLIPKRVRNDSKMAWLNYVLFPATLTIFICLVLFMPFPCSSGENSSSVEDVGKDKYDMVMATVFRYMYSEWEGRRLIFFSVVWSMFASLLNPFWYTNRKSEDGSSENDDEDKKEVSCNLA